MFKMTLAFLLANPWLLFLGQYLTGSQKLGDLQSQQVIISDCVSRRVSRRVGLCCLMEQLWLPVITTVNN